MFENTKQNEMATTKKAVNEVEEGTDTVNEGAKTAGATNALATQQNDNLTFEEMFDTAKKSKGVEITAEYLNIDKLTIGERSIFIFLGMTKYTNSDGEVMPAVMLADENKQQFILSSKVVVSALARIADDCPVAVGITYNGKEKSASGKGSYFACSVERF